MEEDTKPILVPVGGDESNYGIMNIQFNPEDYKCKRPFHVEPTNIVSVNDDMQRVTDEASAMNKRIHYYSRLTSPADRALIYDMEYHDGYIHIKYPLGNKTALTDTSNWEFPDVCKYYFGSFGQWSSLLFSMVSLVGAMVVYWVLMSNFLFNTGKFIYNFVHDINVTDIVPGTNGSNKVICPSAASDHPPQNRSVMFSSSNRTGFELFEEWWDKSQTVPFYLIAVLLPLLNLKSPSFFAKFNVLGTVSVVYLVFLVTVKAAHLGIHLEFSWVTENEFFVPEFRILFPQLTGVLTLAFFIHNCVITLLQNNKNQENNVRDLSIAYFLVGLTYLYVGVIIFASFPSPPLSKECIEQNFLDNFPSDDIMSFVARIFLLFQMMTVYPLLGYLARVQLLRQFFGNAYPSLFHVLVLNLAIVGAGVAMARFYPNIGGIIRYSGATCGLAFVFVYPSLIYMISLHRAGQLTWPALIIHIFIILLGLANLIAQFLL
ncbi:hypothetical protein DUI87_28141 [Hirundo rustica rustica]|uniref:Neutral amino acid transporter 9 n=1 Tax=Hirundo rustica rustica TaxID=333673 RepID=A0A3M0J9C4_HIRRU|nr:hypothetical protein DUI87_28141 [Hirundo rustica rustica]